MNLNLEDKVILITQDQRGICQYIFNVLTQEGAQPFIVNHQDLNNFEGYQMDAIVNISDGLQNTIVPLEMLNPAFETPFTLIHIKPAHLLSFKLETDTPLHFNTAAQALPQSLGLKTNTIVYPTHHEHNSPKAMISQIANTTAFLLSNRSKPMKHQTIFIDEGLPVHYNNHMLHQLN